MYSDRNQPFYYENRFFVIRAHRKDMAGNCYVGPKKKIVFSFDDASQFATADEARRALARLPKSGLLCEIEAVTVSIGPISPLPEFMADIMERVPLPYNLVAYEWHCGGDVRSWLLTYRSKSSFYRYRKKLMEYGIDISTPSQVVLLGEQSYC